MALPPYLTPESESPRREQSAAHASRGRRRTATLICFASACGIAGGAIVATLVDRDPGAARTDQYPSEVRALGLASGMSTTELREFGKDECLAARVARRDDGAALLRFKGQHVADAYKGNDQAAIEDFRILFRATGHLLCSDVASVINHASRPLL